MKIDVIMPKLGESIMEGTIIKWWKQPGETIEKDETLLEISTDKVDSEIPSPAKGIVAELLAQENDTVDVGALIARIDTEASVTVAKPQPKKEEHSPKEVAETLVVQAEKPQSAPQSKPKLERTTVAGVPRIYTPLVLSIAKVENITMDELGSIDGTGQNGRVTKKDLRAYIEGKASSVVPIDSAQTPKIHKQSVNPIEQVMKTPQRRSTDKEQSGDYEIVPMDNIRKKTMHHMRNSLDTSAHVYFVSECDVTDVMNLVKSKGKSFLDQEGFKLTITPFIIRSVVDALKDFKQVNSSVEGETILLKKAINIGLAVATDRGLMVPTIKNTEEKNFIGIARATNDIVQRTRLKKITLDDIQGSTFTISNFGVFGNTIGFPIINQPNVAILGVGVVQKKPVVLETELGDSIVVRSMMNLSLSFDHRIIDGDLGGKFLQRICQYLTNTPGTF